MQRLASWPFVPLLALAVPVLLAGTAAIAPRRGAVALRVSLGLALALAVAFALGLGTRAAARFGVCADTTTVLVLLLVTTLGGVVARFSETYLRGDPGLERYRRWLGATLAAVTLLVVSGNLLVIAGAWMATSLALHPLLTFYGDRPAAVIAAHKKFLVARCADLSLALALGLVHARAGSFELARIAAVAAAEPRLPASLEIAAALLVLAVALRSAQLPFHGWITQVMEAPTPVSALLHAGVVNIGGLVLLRVSPWLAAAELARELALGIGLVSTVVAALVTTTRVSVKVALAWSTCAQMGFMLVECGLGLFSLALLHLVAHSLYKAHAFLAAGGAVDRWRDARLAPAMARPTTGRLAAATLLGLGVAFGAARLLAVLGAAPPSPPAEAVFAVVVGLAAVPLVLGAHAFGAPGAVARLLGFVTVSAAIHAGVARLVPLPTAPASVGAFAVAGLGLAVLFAVKSALQLHPEGRLARALHPWLFAGFYLDELFTRLTFRVWPPRLPATVESSPPPFRAPATLEVPS